MTKIVCHLGLHKTASGTLQRQFLPACGNVNLLTTEDTRVRRVVEEIARRDPLYFSVELTRSIIKPLLRDDQVNLLSNESLSGPPYAGLVEWGLDHRTPVLSNLAATFPDASIVLVLRRQDGLARSLYRQYVKRGGTVRPGQFYGKDQSGRLPLLTLDRFQFLPYVRDLFSRFGDRVLILTFEQFLTNERLFLDRLCSFIGTERPSISLRPENATRLGPFGIDLTRRLNFLMYGMLNHGVIPRIPVRRRGRWILSSPIELVHDYWPGRPRNVDSELGRISQEIWSLYRDDNCLLDERFNLGLKEWGYY